MALSAAPTLWQAPTTAFSASPFGWLQVADREPRRPYRPHRTWPTTSSASMPVRSARPTSATCATRSTAVNPSTATARNGLRREMARFGFDAGALALSYGLAESNCAVTVPVPGGGLQIDEIHGGSRMLASYMRKHAVLGEAIPGMQIRITPGRRACRRYRRSRGRRDRDPRHVDDVGLSGRGTGEQRKLVPHRRYRLLHGRRSCDLRARKGTDHRGGPQHVPDRDRARCRPR